MFEFDFFYPLLGIILLSALVIAILGSFVTYNSYNYLSSSLTHATLGGVGLALFFGLPVLWSGQIFALILGIGAFSYFKNNKSRLDAYLDIVYAFGMSIGAFFISLSGSYQKNFSDFFFGSLILAGYAEFITLLCVSLLIVVYMVFNYKKIITISFDADFAQIAGINSKAHLFFLIAVLSFSLPLLVRVLGIAATVSLISTGPLAMERFSNSFIKILIFTTLFNICAFFSGIVLSFYFDWQVGSTISLVAIGLFFTMLLIDVLIKRIKA